MPSHVVGEEAMSVKTTVVLELTLTEAGAVCIALGALMALSALTGGLPPGVDADALRTAVRKLLVAGEVGGTKAELRLRDVGACQ